MVFEKLRLQYYNVLAIRTASLTFIFATAFCLVIFYLSSMALTIQVLGLSVEFAIVIFYGILLLFFITPRLPGHESRSSFFRLLKLVFFPSATISFPEVLVADAMTSLSKVFKDAGIATVAILSKLTSTALVDHHDMGMVLVALLASLPFWIRVRQCSVQLDGALDNVSKIPIMLNIIKYCTAFPPIWLAAAGSLGYMHPDLIWLTAAASFVNSTYGFIWDIVMDWGLLTFFWSGRVTCRSRFLLPPFFHLVAVSINLCLRFMWAANQIPFLAALPAVQLILLVQLAEAFRRAMWNIFRVEWEIIVQHERASVKLAEKIDPQRGVLVGK